MIELCFMSNLTSSEWAAWVQAIGSIGTIIIAAWVAVWQVRKYHDNALAVKATEKLNEKIELGKTLLALSINCSKALLFYRTS
jgi:uncharacterized membrane protein